MFDELVETSPTLVTICAKRDGPREAPRSMTGSADGPEADEVVSLEGLSGSGDCEAEREGVLPDVLHTNTTDSATLWTCMWSCLTASTTCISLDWSRCWQ